MDAVRGPSLDPRLLRLARHSSAALRALTKLDLLLTVVIPVLLPARRSRAMLRTLAVRHLPVRGVVAAGVDASVLLVIHSLGPLTVFVIPVLLPARRSRVTLPPSAVRHLPVRGVVAADADALMFLALVASLRLPVPLNSALMGDGLEHRRLSV
jgi:hypothetical protein